PVQGQHGAHKQELLANLRYCKCLRDCCEHQASISSQLPPAASIFSLAEAEKPCALTVRPLVSSPLPSTFTGWLRVARPTAFRLSGVTSAPASKRSSRSDRLTGCVNVRKLSSGIDFCMRGPRSLRIRT